MFNAETAPASFVLPELPSGVWRLAIDTAQPCDDADRSPRGRGDIEDTLYALGSRSSAILVATE
jgi:hypothetical protein